jgi:hypothetical protein
MHTCELFSMIKWEIFLQKEGYFRICNKGGSSDIKKRVSLICENTSYFKIYFCKYGSRKCKTNAKSGRVHMCAYAISYYRY